MMHKKLAVKLMIGLLLIVIIFHFTVLLEFIAYDKVWAGKINSIDEMRVFETISILINILLMTTLFFKLKHLKNNTSHKVTNAIIWLFVVLFALNTIGNLFATTIVEKTVGTALTFISAVLCWVIVKKDK
jgi:hypothetical protein